MAEVSSHEIGTKTDSLPLLEPGGEGGLAEYVAAEYETWGPNKPMMDTSGFAADPNQPKYALLRKFAGDNDLLVILNTLRCAYQCHFCTLPANSSRDFIGTDQIIAQFGNVIQEHRSALSIIDKVTLSNDGSILDEATMPVGALTEIIKATAEMRRVRQVELETRLEYVNPERMRELSHYAGRATIGILTGFETANERIRDKVLKKRESLIVFRAGLDKLEETATPLTAYVLFKPDPGMTDAEAIEEADTSIQFLTDETAQRGLPLRVRLNPMYAANGSRWARQAEANPNYLPPRLTDVMRVAERATSNGVPIYIGLSVEDRADESRTYRTREDFQRSGRELIRQAASFNDGKISVFDLPPES